MFKINFSEYNTIWGEQKYLGETAPVATSSQWTPLTGATTLKFDWVHEVLLKKFWTIFNFTKFFKALTQLFIVYFATHRIGINPVLTKKILKNGFPKNTTYSTANFKYSVRAAHLHFSSPNYYGYVKCRRMPDGWHRIEAWFQYNKIGNIFFGKS